MDENCRRGDQAEPESPERSESLAAPIRDEGEQKERAVDHVEGRHHVVGQIDREDLLVNRPKKRPAGKLAREAKMRGRGEKDGPGEKRAHDQAFSEPSHGLFPEHERRREKKDVHREVNPDHLGDEGDGEFRPKVETERMGPEGTGPVAGRVDGEEGDRDPEGPDEVGPKHLPEPRGGFPGPLFEDSRFRKESETPGVPSHSRPPSGAMLAPRRVLAAGKLERDCSVITSPHAPERSRFGDVCRFSREATSAPCAAFSWR